MKPARPKPIVRHARSERQHLRRQKRKHGPAAMRRRERRAGLQKRVSSVDQVRIENDPDGDA